jgi:type III restriction enzyme
MSRLEPKDYQSKAIEEMSGVLSQLLITNTNLDRRVILHSPVGSGKTLTMAYALAKANDNPINRPFITLWLSPGKGGLHLQSARALTAFLEDSSITVKLLDTRDDIASNSKPSAGTLFVVNWEKLHSEKDGEWTNRMLRPGETANLFTLLQNATDAGLDMITVVDESHTQLKAPQTQKLMTAIAKIRPSIQVEISATPSTDLDPSLQHKKIHNRVYVDFEDVEAEGMVRRSAILNEDFASVQARHNGLPLEQQALWGAWEKLEDLTKRYRYVGSSVTPLLLIQYPDGAQAGPRASAVEQFLEDRGLAPNETYATWLSEHHSPDLKEINQNSSPYRALIFKQAIATGWDCPRAQVLVQFRKPGSETFKIQTIGRIMRTPEQRHYTDEALNVAYVYSDLPDISVEVTSSEPDFAVRDLSIIRGSQYPVSGLKLTSVFQPRRRAFHYPVTKHLDPALRAELDLKVQPLLTNSPPTPTTSRVLTNSSIDAKSLLGGNAEFSGDSVDGVLSDAYVQAICDQILTSRIEPYLSKEQSRSRIKRSLMNWFSEKTSWSETEVQYFVIAKSGAISTAINEACANASKADEAAATDEARAQRRINNEWEIPESELVPSSKWVESKNKGLLFNPAFLAPGSSKPESRFEQWLGEEFLQSRIVWWWKNGTRDEKYLGVPYEHNKNDEICYPDYLVMSKSGTLWVVEIKDVHDPDGEVSGRTESKAKGLLSWAHDQKTWPTRAVVAVPQDNRNGGIVVSMGDALAWKPASRDTLSMNDGWTVLNMNETP